MRLRVAILLLLPALVWGRERDVRLALQPIQPGEAIITAQAILIPLVVAEPPASSGVLSNFATDTVAYEQPDVARRKYNVVLKNLGKQPVLVAGGSVLEGGKEDRLIRHDTIVGPGAAVEVECLRASWARKEPTEFRLVPAMAPLYLRNKADFGGSSSVVMTFVARWTDFRNEGDERRSLVALSESKELAAMRKKKEMPEAFRDKKTLGAIAAIRGRLQGMVLFGSNEMVQTYYEPLVKGATYAAAAIQYRAKRAGVPVPGQAVAQVEAAASELLEKVRRAKVKQDSLREGEVGEAWILRVDSRTRGRVVLFDGKLVHLAVYPYDPFQEKLYGGAVEVREEKEPKKRKDDADDDKLSSEEEGLINRFRRRNR